MSARDDFGSDAGRPGGKGGSNGGLANGGVGGGRGGGGGGGGAGRNGGYGSQTGLQTGNQWHGNSAYGPAGGRAVAYGMRDARSLNAAGMGPTRGSYGNFKDMNGNALFSGPVQGQSFYGMNMGQALSQAQRAQQAWNDTQIQHGPLDRPTVPGILSPAPPAIVPAVAPPPPAPPVPPLRQYPYWSGTGMWWGNGIPWSNNSARWPNQPPQQPSPTHNYNNTDPSGYPNLNPAGPYADDW